MSILQKIVQQKKQEVVSHKRQTSQEQLEEAIAQLPPTRSLYQVLNKPGEVALIAEIKKASPSKGVIRADFDPVAIGQIYTKAGAAAISILTDEEFFQGHLDYLAQVRKVTHLPLLRKDFLIDPYQIYQARAVGADAVLLIAAILSDEELTEFHNIAGALGLDCLVEVHTQEELERVLTTPARIIGINNRNLNTFKTDLDTTFRLKELIQRREILVVSESGINTRADVEKLAAHGINAMLVGEALMRQDDIGRQTGILLGTVDEKAVG
ncbi:MAG: indole-3-glycerol phosphate synthase TrpC [Clostridia bacterium]|nr:indole-3-glycerol phosphate synthase TrpC [Clostridia bacterium]